MQTGTVARRRWCEVFAIRSKSRTWIRMRGIQTGGDGGYANGIMAGLIIVCVIANDLD